ncbi:MAG: 16S rRNA (cytosine(1402)-N(4))-methyltransferase RsmH [Prevotella sp.]|nr:16S rRNA (cytosine(1402)-N(4))-methyltransferase RsmH [Prevotella sp.]
MNGEQYTYHTPVLLQESIDALDVKANGVYADVTFGGGGHSRELLSRLGNEGRLYSFDQDEDAEENIGRVENRGSFTFVRSNFRYISNWMRYYGEEYLDGILADLGVSSHHFDDAERGFSFRYDAPLDMRMNKRAGTTAADIINTYDEKQLAEIFYLYGEMKNSRAVAKAIVNARLQDEIKSTGQLASVLEPVLKKEREKKELAKAFQALRIEVNHEMEALAEMLASATNLLRSGGRLVVITYHSLEDRLVKNIMKTGNVRGVVAKDFYGNVDSPYKMVGKVVLPTYEEQERNPRSRSAKLRIAEKR